MIKILQTSLVFKKVINTCASLLVVKGNEPSNGVISDVLGGCPLVLQPHLHPLLKEQAQSIPGTVLNGF